MTSSTAFIKSIDGIRAYHSADLSKHDKLMKLLETYSKVTLSGNDHYAEKLTWCLENCQFKFRDMKNDEGMCWYFESQNDASLFALKWS